MLTCLREVLLKMVDTRKSITPGDDVVQISDSYKSNNGKDISFSAAHAKRTGSLKALGPQLPSTKQISVT